MLNFLNLIFLLSYVKARLNSASLHEHLKSKLKLSPYTENNQKLLVYSNLQLLRLIDVEEHSQQVLLFVLATQRWFNPHLSWNSTYYENIDHLILKSSDVWQPDSLLHESTLPDGYANPPLSELETYVKINSNGTCEWIGEIVIKKDCNIHLKQFPFDEHKCSIILTSSYSSKNRLGFILQDPEKRIDERFRNKEWELKIMEINESEMIVGVNEQSSIKLKFSLHRNAYAYYVNFFVPCILLSILMILAFLIPLPSLNRHNHALNILLTIIIFEQLTMDILPPYAFPVLSEMYFCTMLLSFLSLVIVTMGLNMFYREGKVISRFVHVIVIDWCAVVVLMTRRYYNYTNGKHDIDPISVNRCIQALNQLKENTNLKRENSRSENIDFAVHTNIDLAVNINVDFDNADYQNLRRTNKTEAIKMLIEEEVKTLPLLDGMEIENTRKELREKITSSVNRLEVEAVIRSTDRLFLLMYVLTMGMIALYAVMSSE
ncbi:neuronal acetylcholine receptor subunit alpha-7-like [Hydractinia symbiolongicarpus]|uniref:neuronal acetylcholine receptor subunit alpha-7-like n=1 Tax=Hydractinia symbiolongicarpus TaxID=13093 RepID=UPI00254E0B5C|nr:neuronal acetylcholine receptor subunit alpha-7-like [Hydractinia symbiolongicarpus]XP_057298318.1 neuronal acetylcholine receptor subunit alpha-7-like [Hydractinia symbiolongicarpus]